MANRKSWRCFHCGDLFTNAKHAAAHFGVDQLSEPGCVAVLRHGESHLLDRIVDLEDQLARYRNEDSDVMRWQAAKQSDYATSLVREEEKGYERGVRDMRAHFGSAKLSPAIEHGDAVHREWLLEALDAFFDGRPVPPMRGP